MPDQAKTPIHTFRCDWDLWNAAKAKADSDGTTVTAVLLLALRAYTS